jgi:formate-dependent nitrite reductase cytochrome c552 subunit
MSSRQQMRSYVCGQCHVTYYFQPPNKRLTFPWNKGLKVEDIIAVEDEQKIKEPGPAAGPTKQTKKQEKRATIAQLQLD